MYMYYVNAQTHSQMPEGTKSAQFPNPDAHYSVVLPFLFVVQQDWVGIKNLVIWDGNLNTLKNLLWKQFEFLVSIKLFSKSDQSLVLST